MATRVLLRTLLSSANQTLIPRSYTTSAYLQRLRPVIAVAAANLRQPSLAATNARAFSTNQTTSSLNDSNPNWSDRPPKETILLDGCDFEHWLVVVEKPEGEPTRDEIIDSYINTLAQVVGSYDEARMKMYSVSTRCYYAFGALVSEEVSYKIKELPNVRWVLPDSYLDVKNKDYGGEPFIDGKAVPYDPKYHEDWIRNNARANERNRRNDRPRNFDRSRNFERRRENMQQTNRGPMGGPPPPNNMGGPPPPNMGGGGMPPPPGYMGGPPPPNNMGGPPPPPPNMPPPGYMGGPPPPPPNMRGPPPPSNMGYGGQPNNWNGPPPQYSGGPPNMGGGMPPPNNMGGGMRPNNPPPNYHHHQQQQHQGWNGQNGGGSGYAPPPPPPNVGGGGGNPYQNQDVPGRDMPLASNYE